MMPSPPRMRIWVLGSDPELERRLLDVGHRVTRSGGDGDVDMVLIAETTEAAVVSAVGTLPQLRGKILAHTCPGLAPLQPPDVVSVAFSRIHPALDVWAVASRDELGATLCELLLRELEYQFVGAEYRERLAAAYNALLQVAELPEELLLSLVRGLKQ